MLGISVFLEFKLGEKRLCLSFSNYANLEMHYSKERKELNPVGSKGSQKSSLNGAIRMTDQYKYIYEADTHI